MLQQPVVGGPVDHVDEDFRVGGGGYLAPGDGAFDDLTELGARRVDHALTPVGSKLGIVLSLSNQPG